jgi:hypothetical protein
MDRAVAVTVTMRLVSAFTGAASLLFIASFLSKPEQAFYYAFASIVALQVFFELGLSYVVMQCASHEKAHLDWDGEGRLQGDGRSKRRLASLLRLSARWYVAIGLLMLLLVGSGGYLFLGQNTHSGEVAWQAPWIALICVFSAYATVSALFSFLEGLGLVADVALGRLVQTVVGTAAMWSVFLSGGKLFASPSYFAMFLLVGAYWVFVRHGKVVRDLLRTPPGEDRIDWFREVWPFQWKIALSWLSGYFIYHLFVPVLFAVDRTAEAAQMGMALQVIAAIQGLAFAWVSTKAPRFGSLVALKKYDELDPLFRGAMIRSASLAGAMVLVFLLLLVGLNSANHPYAERIVSPGIFALLGLAIVLNSFVASWGVYLRAHKEEPLLKLSCLCAGIMLLGAVLTAPRFGASGLVATYLVMSTTGILFASRIFLHCRRCWRGAAGPSMAEATRG